MFCLQNKTSCTVENVCLDFSSLRYFILAQLFRLGLVKGRVFLGHVTKKVAKKCHFTKIYNEFSPHNSNM